MNHDAKVDILLAVAERAGRSHNGSHPIDIGCAMQNAIEHAAETLDVIAQQAHANRETP